QSALRRLDLEGKADQAHVDETVHLYELKAQAIINSNDPVWKAWQKLQGDMRQDLADTWSKALETQRKSLKQLAAEAIDQFLAPWRKLVGALLTEWQTNFLQKIGISVPGAQSFSTDLSSKAAQAVTPATTGVPRAAAGMFDIKNPSLFGYEID